MIIKFLKNMSILGILLYSVMSFSIAAYAEGSVEGIVIDKDTKLMKEPKTSTQTVQQLSIGEIVYIEENQGKWYRVSTSNAMWGWVHSASILITDQESRLIEEGIVNVGSLIVHEKPDINGKLVGRLALGSRISIVGKEADWYHVAIGDEMIGWVSKASIITGPSYPKAQVTTEKTQVWSQISKDSKKKAILEKNTVVKIKNFQKDWFYITWGENLEGWIEAKEVKVIYSNRSNSAKAQMSKETQTNDLENFDDIIARATYLGDAYKATAYDLSIASCGKAVGAKYRGMTSTGINLNGKSWKDAMVIAVDPGQIPLGSEVLVLFDEKDWRSAYNGVYLAGDTGGAVKGKKIDLYLGDIGNKQMKEVRDFGTATNVKVYLLK
ncbi:SH3 domain-containing protein [Clostridiaceae bacterium 35-E11]